MSMKAHEMLMSYSGNSHPKMHCGNVVVVVNMSYYAQIFSFSANFAVITYIIDLKTHYNIIEIR